MEAVCATILAFGLALCAPEAATPYFADVSAMALPAKTGSSHSMGATAADLDGDGDLDLAIAVEYGQNRVLINDGTGHFAEGTLAGPSGDHEDVAIADYDGDGDPDLVFAGEDDQVQGYHLNDDAGGFTDVTARLPRRGIANAVVASDIDADGDFDLVVGNNGEDFIFVNDSAGHFADESGRLPASPDTTQDIAVGDVDADGDPDLLFGNEDGNKLYRNDGAGYFAGAPLPGRANEETRDADFVDVDGDGDLDIYFANVRLSGQSDRQDRILLNDGTGAFTDVTATHLAPDDETTTSAAFLDWDFDGDLDLIRGPFGDLSGATSDFPLLTFVNDGNGRFSPAEGVLPRSVAANAFDIEIADFTGDGIPDLFVASRGGDDRLAVGVK